MIKRKGARGPCRGRNRTNVLKREEGIWPFWWTYSFVDLLSLLLAEFIQRVRLFVLLRLLMWLLLLLLLLLSAWAVWWGSRL